MALRGTLSNFGIADVFSLIGSQNKSGVLVVQGKSEKVVLHFADGAVIHVEATGRQRQDLLGNMLVRAEVITEQQLSTALSGQQAHQRRLGDELIAMGVVTAVDLQTFAKLQTTETVYRVFLWRNGTYEFNQAESAPELRHPPVRAESLLMEGFRQADEWPAIRRKISSYGILFAAVANLDELLAANTATAGHGADDELNFDMGFGESASQGDARLSRIGTSERLIFSLINGQRDVQKLIDLSRLGEFDTCQALVNLMDASIVAPRGETQVRPSAEATVGGISGPRESMVGDWLAQIGWAVAMVVGWVLLCQSGLGWLNNSNPRQAAFLDMHLELEMGRGSMQRIANALAVYHAMHGEYPEALATLVQDGLLPANEMQFPWRQPYHYVSDRHRYTLLRPLF